MTESRIKSEWLVGNAVVAFMGAILLGTSLRSSADDASLPWSIPLPNLPDILVIVLICALIILSMFFAAASVINSLQPFAMRTAQTFEPVFMVLFFLAFTIGYLTAAAELPYEHWWAFLLFFGGYALFLFIPIRYVVIHVSDYIQTIKRRRN